MTQAVTVSIALSLADTTCVFLGADVPSSAISSVVGDIKSSPFRVIAEIIVIGDESNSIKSWNCLSIISLVAFQAFSTVAVSVTITFTNLAFIALGAAAAASIDSR